jgi:HPt (histidine-containing phosphotransfer) domain-containing protein
VQPGDRSGELADIKKKGEAMQKSESQPSNPAWNFEEFLRRVDNDRELLQELVIIFQKECPRHLNSLKAAVAQKNSQNVAAVAHALKGMLSNLAGSRAAAAAGSLEKLARGGELAAMEAALLALEREVGSLLPEVETYMAEVHS